MEKNIGFIYKPTDRLPRIERQGHVTIFYSAPSLWRFLPDKIAGINDQLKWGRPVKIIPQKGMKSDL